MGRYSEYESRAYLQPGQQEISAKAYNMIIGGTLLYGFVVNAIIVLLFNRYLNNMSYSAAQSFANNYGGILIGVLIGYIACVLIGGRMISKQNAKISFIGFNFYCIPIGIVLAIAILPYYDVDTIQRAFILTALLTAVVMVLSTIMPDAFLNMGKTLLICASACLLVDLVALLIFRQDLTLIDFALTIIFALFIGYDWARASLCAKTADNAVDCAALLYLNIINVFLRALQVMSKRK